MSAVNVTLNGKPVSLEGGANAVLIDALRDDLHLRGSKLGCDQAVCGACTVLVNGDPYAACSTFLFEIEGADIVTVEGVNGGKPGLSDVQRAFVESSAFQCGYCTPGLVMLVTAMLAKHPNPDDATIKSWLATNICRCTGYQAIFAAVRRAIELRSMAKEVA